MDWFNKKIVGLGEIVEEVVKKEVATPNTLKQTILRTTTSCIVLECGHKIKVTAFGKVPTRYTNCYECERQARGERTGMTYLDGEKEAIQQHFSNIASKDQ